MDVSEKLILATDELSRTECLEFVAKFGSRFYAIKVHNHFDDDSWFPAALREQGAQRVWIDAKLHDVPNTVKLRASAIAEVADILTVHASGGLEMMKAAVEAGPHEIYAITVLTSIDAVFGAELFGRPTIDVAIFLTELAEQAGVHGVVCSPQEVQTLSVYRKSANTKLITPGIRPAGVEANDQKRVGTPRDAILKGSSHLVVGRAITKAADPAGALEQIEQEVAAALEELEGKVHA